MSDKKTSVLFVCMGNICRSPVAECLFRTALEELNRDSTYFIDSAGTGGWHAGANPDRRMRAAAKKQGMNVTGSARQITTDDFARFDWIFCMDQDNLDDVLSMGACPEKTKLLLSFVGYEDVHEVPDPYYGGDDGFDVVISLIHVAVQKLTTILS